MGALHTFSITLVVVLISSYTMFYINAYFNDNQMLRHGTSSVLLVIVLFSAYVVAGRIK